jgi:sulfonate transport system substrate-binding protein
MASDRNKAPRLRHAALVVGFALCLLSACHRHSDVPVLRVGDMKGGDQVALEAAHALEGATYRVEWASFPSASGVLEALNAQAVDIVPSGDAAFLFAYANGLPARIISTSRQQEASSGAAIVVRADAPVRSIADLRGKTVAVTRGSSGHFLLLCALRAAGLHEGDIHISYLAPTEGKAALLSGAVDAWSIWDPHLTMAELHDHVRPIADGKSLNIHMQIFTIASPEAIATKRAMIADFLRRQAAAKIWVRDHPRAYAEAWSRSTGLPINVATAVVARGARLPAPIDARATAEFRQTFVIYHNAGLVRNLPDIASAFDPSFNRAGIDGTAPR